MKLTGILILTIILVTGIISCEKDADQLITKTENLSLGSSYTNDIFYRLSDGNMTQVPRLNWDIAFSVATREASILTNEGSGVVLKVYPTTTGWTWPVQIDTTGFHNWTPLYNSDTTWSEGAFNMNATGHPNYGWCTYDMTTHNLTGIALYIIKTRNGSFRQIWIEKKFSVDQKYLFRYADLNGSNEQNITLQLAGKNKNFVYYSLETNAEVDREPASDTWDIVFTKWFDNSINYPVTGVLQNIGVGAISATNANPSAEPIPATGFQSNISTIGSNWKTINMTTFVYEIDATRLYFVKDLNEKAYKIIFKSFEGTATGNLSFEITSNK